jgi:hypothetical protein
MTTAQRKPLTLVKRWPPWLGTGFDYTECQACNRYAADFIQRLGHVGKEARRRRCEQCYARLFHYSVSRAEEPWRDMSEDEVAQRICADSPHGYRYVQVFSPSGGGGDDAGRWEVNVRNLYEQKKRQGVYSSL